MTGGWPFKGNVSWSEGRLFSSRDRVASEGSKMGETAPVPPLPLVEYTRAKPP